MVTVPIAIRRHFTGPGRHRTEFGMYLTLSQKSIRSFPKLLTLEPLLWYGLPASCQHAVILLEGKTSAVPTLMGETMSWLSLVNTSIQKGFRNRIYVTKALLSSMPLEHGCRPATIMVAPTINSSTAMPDWWALVIPRQSKVPALPNMQTP